MNFFFSKSAEEIHTEIKRYSAVIIGYIFAKIYKRYYIQPLPVPGWEVLAPGRGEGHPQDTQEEKDEQIHSSSYNMSLEHCAPLPCTVCTFRPCPYTL
jgi:hypothetical protein